MPRAGLGSRVIARVRIGSGQWLRLGAGRDLTHYQSTDLSMTSTIRYGRTTIQAVPSPNKDVRVTVQDVDFTSLEQGLLQLSLRQVYLR